MESGPRQEIPSQGIKPQGKRTGRFFAPVRNAIEVSGAGNCGKQNEAARSCERNQSLRAAFVKAGDLSLADHPVAVKFDDRANMLFAYFCLPINAA